MALTTEATVHVYVQGNRGREDVDIAHTVISLTIK